MERKTKKFLKENFIPEHVCFLLECYGITFLQDLLKFNEQDILNIEEDIRKGGTLIGLPDFKSKATCKKYLGIKFSKNVSKFTFRPMDRKKLLLLSAAAREEIDPSQTNSPGFIVEVKLGNPDYEADSFPMNSTSSDMFRESCGDDFKLSEGVFANYVAAIECTEPNRKKRKQILSQEQKEIEILQKIEAYSRRAIQTANNIWDMTNIEERVDESHIDSRYDENKERYIVSVQCLLCNTKIVFNQTAYSLSGNNYKTHIKRKHLLELNEEPKPRQTVKTECFSDPIIQSDPLTFE